MDSITHGKQYALILGYFVLVAKLYLTILQPHGLLPGVPVHGISQARILGCHLLLQGIFPTRGSNVGLLHCRQILYHGAIREALEAL